MTTSSRSGSPACRSQNDAGQETYGGPPAINPDLPALKQAVLFDASEGAIGWYVGYAGDGCLAFEVTTGPRSPSRSATHRAPGELTGLVRVR